MKGRTDHPAPIPALLPQQIQQIHDTEIRGCVEFARASADATLFTDCLDNIDVAILRILAFAP